MVFIFCMLSFSPVCWGHDLAGGTLYRIRNALFGWMSKPPVIAEDVRSRVRENVLLCIGATNLEVASDFDLRYNASGKLGTNLSVTELELLYSFLEGKLGGRDPLCVGDIDLIKDSICDSLLFRCGSRPPDGFGLKLMDMITARRFGVERRKMYLLNLTSYYEAKWRGDSYRLSNTERNAIETFLVALTKDKRFADDTVAEITYLSKIFPEIVEIMKKNKLTPVSSYDQIMKMGR